MGARGSPPPQASAAAAHAASVDGASVTSAQRLPPMRSKGSASSQRTSGGAVAREVARSKLSRVPGAAPRILGANRLDLHVAQPEQPGDVHEEPALADVGLEHGHAQVGAHDREDDRRHAAARSDVDDAAADARCRDIEKIERLLDMARPRLLARDRR